MIATLRRWKPFRAQLALECLALNCALAACSSSPNADVGNPTGGSGGNQGGTSGSASGGSSGAAIGGSAGTGNTGGSFGGGGATHSGGGGGAGNAGHGGTVVNGGAGGGTSRSGGNTGMAGAAGMGTGGTQGSGGKTSGADAAVAPSPDASAADSLRGDSGPAADGGVYSGPAVLWMSSTSQTPWKSMTAPEITTASAGTTPEVRIEQGTKYQTIDGFGGCFNELGWSALGKATAADRQSVLAALFGDDGCGFNLARVPIGASDFALDGYSLDDTAGDVELKNFSLARDEKNLIPYIKAAMAVRPTLKVWGSPWSPPVWMKTNNGIGGGSLKWEPSILSAYATYMAKWVEGYRAAGMNVYGLSPQNEPNITNVYPTCLWTAAQLREFIATYLGPTLRDRKTEVELWLGLNGDPFNGGEDPNNRLGTVMKDPTASAFLTGIEFQYDSKSQMCTARDLYPSKKLMQGETECKGGANSWGDAQSLYSLMKRYLDCGANAYFLWNMVLDETGASSWGWKQNASITVNKSTGKVTYNGEYYVMRHFSQFVKPGAKRVLSSGSFSNKIAFINQDGSAVVVLSNATGQAVNATITVDGRTGGDTIKVSLPAQSMNTIVVAPAQVPGRFEAGFSASENPPPHG
jgi:glucosylceramidase